MVLIFSFERITHVSYRNGETSVWKQQKTCPRWSHLGSGTVRLQLTVPPFHQAPVFLHFRLTIFCKSMKHNAFENVFPFPLSCWLKARMLSKRRLRLAEWVTVLNLDGVLQSHKGFRLRSILHQKAFNFYIFTTIQCSF